MSRLLNASHLSWKLGETSILNDISLHLDTGELVGVVGPNGAGKSSLLKILANIEHPQQGQRQLLGEAYADIDLRNFARRLAYLEQEARVNWPLSVEKVIQLGRSPYQSAYSAFSQADDKAIREAVAATAIEHLLGRIVTNLSQGEKMLIALTRIFATQPGIILADEPVAALDPYHQLLIMELLQAHSRKQNQACMVVLHDLSLAARFCDRIVLMYEGRIVDSGPPEAVFNAENLREFYGILCYSDFSQAIIQPLQRV